MNGSSHVTNYCIKQCSCWLAQSVGHQKGHPMNFQLTNDQLRWRHPWKSSKSSAFLKVLAKNWEENSTKNAISTSFVQFRFRLLFLRFPSVFCDRGKSLALHLPLWQEGSFWWHCLSLSANIAKFGPGLFRGRGGGFAYPSNKFPCIWHYQWRDGQLYCFVCWQTANEW